MPAPAVNIQKVSHHYGFHQALRDVTFQVTPGTLHGLLGPNGSGKTTLFRILSTLMPPSEGHAQVFGLDTAREPSAVRRRIGTVFQEEALDEALTVRQNLRVQGALYGLHGAERRERAEDLLRRLDVADRATDPVADLSGGLRRRVDLARGLLHRPDLLLLDEPTSGLDPAARRTFWSAVHQLRAEEGTTLLLATHLMDEAERCDRVGILSDGALVANGAPDTLKANLGDETIWLKTDAPISLRDRIEAQFGVSTRIVGATVQVAPAAPPTFLSSLYDALSDHIRSATIRTPTLEDVFMVHAGVSPTDSREHVLAHRDTSDE
ncbi:ABC transporter ATP-binding protein [Salinibacter altiplanensis]|uniref:ABC transporter ATP-binding protein n=1 Tax=Salinibacter altiplanensis TaxID=1803181 RepID=UPI000C9ECECD|nr:ABC transporter ATP-binding protein [Salinibacter altiplanensis]